MEAGRNVQATLGRMGLKPSAILEEVMEAALVSIHLVGILLHCIAIKNY
jgi:hypothetical protein